ncbi:MAG: PEP-CTERM sorting domain-containing protein, partial [Planctomycetota bacterium]|nr:PEP-CTERM sorting domain-containing protein [Planctomycetota bacterium]
LPPGLEGWPERVDQPAADVPLWGVLDDCTTVVQLSRRTWMSDNHENKTSFERRLAGYALACGAAVLGANQAHAGIHYTTGLNQSYGPIPVNGTSDPTNTLVLDVDGDSNNDFIAANLLLDNSSTPDGIADIVEGISGGSLGVVLDPVVSASLSAPMIANLSAGTLIDGSSATNKAGKLSLDTVPTPTYGALVPWNAGASGYIGFAFATNGGADTNFGWVNLEIGSGFELILKGYGYEDVPNQGILAGAPEPSSLALLACGAAGVFALNAARKRRVAESA